MELLDFVELVTTVVTLLCLGSGIPVCLTMIRTRSTRSVPYIYFLVSAINSSLALYYGILVSNSTLIFINTVGLLLSIAYILVYIGVCQSKSKAMWQLVVSLVTVAGHGLYLKMVPPSSTALVNTLGVFLFVWTVLLLLTPVLDIMEIIRQGTSAGTDKFLLLGSTACSTTWLAYGYLLQDIFIYGPNVLGLAVSGAKMATIAAYSGSSGSKMKEP